MDSEIVVWLVIIAFWLLSNLISFIRRAAAKSREAAAKRTTRQMEERPGAQRPSPSPPPIPAKPEATAAADPLAELLKSFGVEMPSAQEEPVASEHVPTRGEHSQAAAQRRVVASEHRHTPGWHERTAAETSQRESDRAPVPSEHRRTASEHRPGDAIGDIFLPALPRTLPASRRKPASGIGRRMIADLHGDRDRLARAILLREVLGPPVGMRSPGERSFER